MAKAQKRTSPREGLDLKAKGGYMNFGEALNDMADGLTLTRKAWWVEGVEDRQLELIQPIPGQIVDTPYIVDWGYDQRRRPWAPSHEDLLATDWLVASAATPT